MAEAIKTTEKQQLVFNMVTGTYDYKSTSPVSPRTNSSGNLKSPRSPRNPTSPRSGELKKSESKHKYGNFTNLYCVC